MSTVRATLVGPISGTTMNLMSGLIKVWVYLSPWASGGTPVPAASFNITSMTDTGVGQATCNFTSAFSSTSYCGVTSGQNSATNTNTVSNIGSRTTTTAIMGHIENSNFTDATTQDALFNGALA